jgi:PAS domain S-box-containing protein
VEGPEILPEPIEDQLRRERELFAFALEAADMVAWDWDVVGDDVVRSRNADRLLGLDAVSKRGSGREFLSFVHPEDRERVRLALHRAVHEGAEYAEELRLLRSDGTVRWVADKGRVTRDETGKPVRMSGVMFDITERRQAEEALRRSERHLQFIADATATYLAHCNAERRYVFVNRAYAERLGLTPDQIVGRTVVEVLGDRAYESIRPYTDRVLSGETFQYEVNLEYPRIGRRHMHCSYTPERDAQGRIVGWVAALMDITDRHRLEQALRESEESLQEAGRRKDEFLATLAHELRNPLAPIRHALEILQIQGSPEPGVQWARGVIGRQVEQLSRLVDDLLDVSRITRGKIELRQERVELSVILDRALETSRPLIEASRHHLTVTVPEEPLSLLADATRMAQVVSNLLNNAAKYTWAGGHIELSAKSEADHVVIRVKDDGIGIPLEMRSRIFDMFTQVDTSLERAQGGLGIGLTIGRRLVEMHGGTLEVESAGLGQGSELIVRLPLTPGTAPPPPGIQETRSEVPGEAPGEAPGPRSALRILVVDDNEDSADSLAVWLGLMGHDARTAHDGPQALATAQEHRPELIFLDIGMPGMNGYEVARRLRQQPETRDVTLIAVTGWGQDEDRRQSREAGFDQHLVKPLEPRSLETLLAGLTPRT